MDNLDENYDGEQLPIALQYDSENGFNRVSRARMIKFCKKVCPTLLRYTRLLYDEPATLYCVHGDRVVDTIQPIDGSHQGDPLGGHHFAMTIFDFMLKLGDFLSPTDTRP